VSDVPALILLAYISLLVSGIVDNIRGPLFPDIINEFSLSGSTGSLFFAVTSLMMIAGGWSAHHILCRRDALFLTWLSSFVFAIGMTLIGLAGGLISLLVGGALVGWSFSSWTVVQNLMVVQNAPPEFRRRFLNGLHSMFGIGALLAPLLASAFRSLGMDWRRSFLILALAPFTFGVWAFLWRSRDRDRRGEEKPRGVSRGEWPTLFALGLILSGYLWGELSVTTRFVLWLRQDNGFAPDRANFYQTFFFTGLLAGRLALSFIHLPGISSWRILLMSAASSGLLYMIGLQVSPKLVLVAGLTMAPFFPVLMDLTNELLREKSSQALAFVVAFSSLAVVFMHVTVGIVSDHFGLTRALQLCAFAQLLACAEIVWLRRRAGGCASVQSP
jgi:FHS family glucose/mannose:H+ symporter-like MFS transporter